MSLKNKSFMTKRKAFTLIELLIVIAIIGILFIVLVSKVDFATDKAKASGVQTDFRSFQMAFDTVAKENAGFNTFGWDIGDANQNGKRDSYDEGDNGAGGGIAQNGIQDGAEVFTGHKIYAETFTKIYSLKKNGTGDYDREALNRLETAINANLDPKLHITIKDDGEIVMANGAQDPWNKEYHGYYITNAEVDGKDRGAIIMYSDGADSVCGSEHTISGGIVTISIPGSQKSGKDDYSIVSCYTYLNGYGEVKNMTTGFSNNQYFNNSNSPSVDTSEIPDTPDTPTTQYVLRVNDAVYVNNSLFVSPSIVLTENKTITLLKLDNTVLSTSEFLVSDNKITFNSEYVKNVSMGNHIVEIITDDGSESCTLVVSSITTDSDHDCGDGHSVSGWWYESYNNNIHLGYAQCDYCYINLLEYVELHADDEGCNVCKYCTHTENHGYNGGTPYYVDESYHEYYIYCGYCEYDDYIVEAHNFINGYCECGHCDGNHTQEEINNSYGTCYFCGQHFNHVQNNNVWYDYHDLTMIEIIEIDSDKCIAVVQCNICDQQFEIELVHSTLYYDYNLIECPICKNNCCAHETIESGICYYCGMHFEHTSEGSWSSIMDGVVQLTGNGSVNYSGCWAEAFCTQCNVDMHVYIYHSDYEQGEICDGCGTTVCHHNNMIDDICQDCGYWYN